MDYVVAVYFGTLLWAGYSGFFGMASRYLLAQHEVFSDMTFALPPDVRAVDRAPQVDPTSPALAASGAHIVDAHEFRACGEMGVLETPHGGLSLRRLGTYWSGNQRCSFS